MGSSEEGDWAEMTVEGDVADGLEGADKGHWEWSPVSRGNPVSEGVKPVIGDRNPVSLAFQKLHDGFWNGTALV